MHVEPLDPRLCCYAGTDTTFGTNGRVELSIDGNPHAIAGTDNSIYVSYDGVTDVNSFATLSARGKSLGGNLGSTITDLGTPQVDRVLPIGDSGAFTIGATNTVATEAPAQHYLYVTRHTADGDADTSFGTSGTFIYDLSDSSVLNVKFVDAVRTDDGGLLIAFDRTSITTADKYRTDVVLLKLRASCLRDKSFGTNGIKIARSTDAEVAIDDTYNAIDAVAGADLTQNDDGTVRLILARTVGDRVPPYGRYPDVASNATYGIESHTFASDGAELSDRVRTWTLVKKNATPGTNNRFAPLLITDDGPKNVTVVGRERVGDSVTRPLAYSLQAGKRIDVSPFATGKATASQVVESDTGKYFALLRGNSVARLNADFTLDNTFGNSGVAKLDTVNLRYTFSPRLFAVPGDRVIVPLLIDGPVDAVLYLTRLG